MPASNLEVAEPDSKGGSVGGSEGDFENRGVPEPGVLERFPWVIFWAGLFVRLAYMTFAHTWHIRPHWNHFEFGFEMGRIARSLATGHGFASPFWGQTGPTAWEPPLYPWLLAGIFKVFGVYTPLAAYVTIAVNCVLGAFTLPAVWRIARRCFNRKTAVWAAWIWALYPAAMQYDVKWIWELSLTCFLFAWAFAWALKMRGIGEPGVAPAANATAGRWVLFALLWALIALSNPSLLLFLPACGLWILWRSPQWKKQLAYGVMAAVVFIACLAPWTYRNYAVFHHFEPVRGDFWFEFFDGNGPASTGMIREYDQPFQAPSQLRLYKRLGEVGFMQRHKRITLRYMAAHPMHFWKLTGERILMYWTGVPHPTGKPWWNYAGRVINFAGTSFLGLFGLGLAMRRRVPGRWLFLWAFALLPLTYYFITVHARFRHPLEPLIDVLAVYLFQSAEKSWKVRWFTRHG